MSIAILAAAPNADLVVGLLLGAAIGLLSGPVVRRGLVLREWREASREAREARLTDQLLSRIEALTDLSDAWPDPGPDHGSRRSATEVEPARAPDPAPDERAVPWRTSR